MKTDSKSGVRHLLFSVSAGDCEMQTFRAGGNGGQNQNKVNSGVRLIHHPSGARGEARDSRSQHDNKKAAFLRLVETPEFRLWHRLTTSALLGQPSIEEVVDEQMKPQHIKVEVRDENGRWANDEIVQG
jgi:hypothetical protein